MSWFTTFLAVFVLDIVWARYTLATTHDRPVVAGRNAVCIIILSGIANISFVHDPWMLIPAAAGAFFGTVVGMMKR